ncbi:MAG: hypothetical protein E6Y86_08455 [Slackia sp.]|nr:hypothetical protein [Slackia sp.]
MKYGTRGRQRLDYGARTDVFAEPPRSLVSQTEVFAATPSGWTSDQLGPWRRVYLPGSLDKLPEAGWKIHVSTTFQDAEKCLATCSSVCESEGVPFKHLQSMGKLELSLRKYADRKFGGKFITIYPFSDTQFVELLNTLNKVLNGMHGPYILTDTRYGDSAPVFFRYGAFSGKLLEDGRVGITAPNGAMVPDPRDFASSRPSFATVPAEVKELVEQRDQGAGEIGDPLYPYSVSAAMHFSYGGGVYRATDTRTGAAVVIKEARDWAGYSSREVSALDRLKREHSALKRLSAVSDRFPKPVELFRRAENSYLVEEFIEGVSLQSWVAAHYPTYELDEDGRRSFGEYEESAVKIASAVVDAVERAHSIGIALMDIQPKNVLVSDDLAATIIDLESARGEDESAVGAVGTPGYVPLADGSNFDRDNFALFELILYMFSPSAESMFSPGLHERRVGFIHAHFTHAVWDIVDAALRAVNESQCRPRFGAHHISGMPSPAVCRFDDDGWFREWWSVSRGELLSGIRRSGRRAETGLAQFPGEYRQLVPEDEGARLDLESGTAGVLMTFWRLGAWGTLDADVRDRAVESLMEANECPAHGLLRGTPGIVMALTEAGFVDEGLALAEASCHRHGPCAVDGGQDLDISVRTGVSGDVLAFGSVHEADPRLRMMLDEAAAALRVALDGGCGVLPTRSSETGNAVGLFDGWAGVALACSAIWRLTGDKYWNTKALELLERDLSLLRDVPGRGSFVDYEGVIFGYLSEGSAGIALAAHLVDAERYAGVIERVSSGISGRSSLNVGLLYGVSGWAGTLVALSSSSRDVAVARGQVYRAVYERGLGFKGTDGTYVPGNDGIYMSVDYGAGASGLALVGESIARSRCLWVPWAPKLFN